MDILSGAVERLKKIENLILLSIKAEYLIFFRKLQHTGIILKGT